MMDERKQSFTSGILQAFLKGNLSILLILISLAVGAAALLITPREEDPQIVVPLADVMVMMPGSSAAEVEQLVSSRLESCSTRSTAWNTSIRCPAPAWPSSPSGSSSARTARTA